MPRAARSSCVGTVTMVAMPQPTSRFASVTIATAAALPTLVAFDAPPSPTLLNQILTVALWACSLLIAQCSRARASVNKPLALALVLAMVTVAGSTWLGGLPATLALGPIAILGCAWITAWRASTLPAQKGLSALFWGLLCAGILNAVIGLLQVLNQVPFESQWIARSAIPGRAVGNLRQPNHLSSLLLWSLISLTTLTEIGRVRRSIAGGVAVLLTTGLVLTGSRTGLLGILLLSCWALLDKRLSRRVRVALAVAPIVYGALWVGLTPLSQWAGVRLGAEEHLIGRGSADISSSRFGIWSNTISMIEREPWTGVGFGEFNLAWTLSAFPGRPTAFFDHSHNLILELFVELGLPLGGLMLVLLGAALARAARHAWRSEGNDGVARRGAVMIVLMIGLHSLLEYPLWYAYFLVPTAFAWGLTLSNATAGEPIAQTGSGDGWAADDRRLVILGMALVFAALLAVVDYRKVVHIYDPPEDALPLEDRIARGQRSPLFGHHADYAAATAFGPPKAPLSPSQELAFKRAPHQLLDVRLMIAWSQALAAQGDLDKARWLAARIREFRNPGADEYFAPCSDPAQAAQAFQCQPPTRVVHWREFTQR
jgi:O-antigen ligase